MKYLFMYLFIFSSTILAQEATNSTLDIESLISKIKTADVSEKRTLINELKIKLRTANKDNRTQAINELKESFRKNKDFTQRNNRLYMQRNRMQQQSLPKHDSIAQGQGRK